jgi:hypothetical protein
MKKIDLLVLTLLLSAFFCCNPQVHGEIPPADETAIASETSVEASLPASKTIVVEPEPEADTAQKNGDNSDIEPDEEPADAENVSDKSEQTADENTTALSETETGSSDDTEADTVSESEIESEPEPEPEPEEPDPFAAEPYAQSSLKDIEEYFSSYHELSEKSAEFSERALAIIAGSSEDRNFRRQCEFLTRVSGHNVYAVGLALIIMPRLLEVSNLIIENSIKTLMQTFADELISEPLAREIRLSELGNHLDSQAGLATLLRQLSLKISNFCDHVELQSSRRHVQGRTPEFLRAANRDMIALLRQQREKLDTLLNQLDLHHQFCQVNLDYFLAVSDHAPAVMQGSQIGRMLRSCLDFAVSLRNYRAEYGEFTHKFTILIETRLIDIEKLVGNDSRRNAKIAGFTGNFPTRDRDDMPESAFSAVEMLQQTFALLDAMLEQSTRLIRDDSSVDSADDQIAPETFKQLKDELSRHLDSASWPIKPLPGNEEAGASENEDLLEPVKVADEDAEALPSGD